MDMTGLSLNLSEFQSLPAKQKLDCLYQNQCTTLNLVRGYRLTQKIHYYIMAALGAGVGLLFRLRVGA